MMNDQPHKVVHFNIPQIRGAVVRAQTEAILAARRAGKTTGIFSERISWSAFRMPRSLGGLVVPSYKKFLTTFITSYIDGLESLGYIEGRDYVIGRQGPKHWDQPFHRPKKYDHGMHWRCGSADVFISQDIPAAGAGLTLDRLAADEAKHLDGDRFEEETLAAMSGHPQYFKNMPEHRGLLIASDRPYDSKGRWFFKYQEQMDPVVIRAIMQLQIAVQQVTESITKHKLTASTIQTYRSQIKKLEAVCNQLRIGATYWHEASTIDNIHVVGTAYLKLMADKMEVGPFTASILNQDISFVAGGFYPDLSDERHVYSPKTSSYTASLGLDRDARERLSRKDSRHDAEIMSKLPLEIAMDYGSRLNCMAIGQMFGDVFRIDNGLHVYHPEKTRDVVQRFIEYYTHHSCKEVIFYYDHTAIGKDGKSDYTYKEIVVDTLRKAGWSVKPYDIGQQPRHEVRYEMWGQMLGIHEVPPFKVQWNQDNCEDMLISMHMVAAKQDYLGFRKNKEPERDTTLDQAHAPHYSDAVDTLVIGRLKAMKNKVSLPEVSGFLR